MKQTNPFFIAALCALCVCMAGCKNELNGDYDTTGFMTVSEAVEHIGAMTESGAVRVYGELTADDIKTLSAAIKGAGNVVLVDLDLRVTTGLKTIETTDSEKGAFYDCDKLRSIALPLGLTSVGDYALFDCDALESVIIPNGVTSIGDYAFYSTALAGVSFPDTVTTIGIYAFMACTKLESVTIPRNVTSVGRRAFYNCFGLTSVVISSGVTEIGVAAFGNVNENQPLASVTLEHTTGWTATPSSRPYVSINLSSADLADPETAAKYLQTTYQRYTWTRSDN